MQVNGPSLRSTSIRFLNPEIFSLVSITRPPFYLEKSASNLDELNKNANRLYRFCLAWQFYRNIMKEKGKSNKE